MNVSIDTLEVQHMRLPGVDYTRIDRMTTLLFVACFLYAAGLIVHLYSECRSRREYCRVDDDSLSDCAL